MNVSSKSSTQATPDAEFSRALERIVEKSGVPPGGNSARLLSYLVTEAAAGRGDRLKAFAIGQDVFQRGPGFDPSKDSIVRVEMKRLRELLDHYYATAGATDPTRISVPKGSYVPTLDPSPVAVAHGEETAQTPDAAGLTPRARFAAAAVIGAAILCLAAFLIWSAVSDPGDAGQGEPRLRIIAAEGTPAAAQGAAMEILSRFRNIELLSGSERRATDSRKDYRLALTPADDTVLVQLIAPGTDRVISSGAFTVSDFSAEVNDLDYTSFQIWLGRAASRNGLIESDYISREAYSGDFACSVLTEAYFSDQTDAHHLEARDCILGRIRNGHDSARLRTDLSLLYREEHSDQRNLLPGDPLERAAREAQAAIALDRFDASAYYALMTVHFAAGAVREGIAMGERSLELNPFDGEALGGFAARLNYVGEHQKALDLFDLSRQLTPGGVTWRDYGYFLAHLGLDDPEAAASAGIGLRGLDNELYLAAVAISASIRGDSALAQETKRTLLDREPDLRWMFERRAYAPDLIDRIMQRLDAIQA